VGEKYHRGTALEDESEIGVIEKIKVSLTKRQLGAWQIRHITKKSYQSFLALMDRECLREVDTESFHVSVYVHHQKDNKPVMGMSSFTMGPNQLERVEEFLDESIFAAGLVNNQPFNLPNDPGILPPVQIYDSSLNQKTLSQCEDELKDAVRAEKNIRLSSAEFFIDQIHTTLINSYGIQLGQDETRIQTEFILLCRQNGQEKEFIDRYTRRYLEDFDIKGEVAWSAQLARDATDAGLPQTGMFPVVLSHETLDRLFEPLLARASARLKYNKMTPTQLGQSVLGSGVVHGDRISILSNGLFKGAMGSTRFDELGTPAQRVCLIENNILKTYLANKQYADYLNVRPTGDLGNIEVPVGSTPYDMLLDPKLTGEKVVYHITAFSAFEPNPVTGAFSAEIRSGYEISPSGQKPIKGGSVTGVLQDALKNCLLSKEEVHRERYVGPRAILFKKLTLAGQ
jgi:PmbA protein